MERGKLHFIGIAVMVFFIVFFGCTKDELIDDGLQLYTVGGTVEGLTGSGLVLQNNSVDELVISENGVFKFLTKLNDSSNYQVEVESYPTGQTCYIENGNGIINGEDISNIRVICKAPFSSDCANGTIDYYHDLSNEYEGFHQEIIVSGTVPFTCDDLGNMNGAGTLIVTVAGTITAQCMETGYTGTADINVTLNGSFLSNQIVFEVNEIWYVGSPMASGLALDTCDPDSQPFFYPLLETELDHTLTFPIINGYTIEQPYIGDSGSGSYSWTLYFD